MKHIIDTDELEKIKVMNRNGDLVIYYNDLIKALANSPQADGMVSTEQIREVINTLQQNKVKANSQCMDSAVEVGAFNEALVVAIKLLEAMLSAYKPQADDVPPDVYDIAVDTGDGIYHTAEVLHFQQSGSKRMIQVRLGEPQADDVRKDAELDWIENDGNHANSKKVANRMGRIDVKFRSGFVAKDYSPNDFDFSQNGSFYDITAFRPHKF